MCLRLMLAEQGVPIRRANAFAWKCRQTEDKTMDSIPGVPSWVIKWATDKKSKDPEVGQLYWFIQILLQNLHKNQGLVRKNYTGKVNKPLGKSKRYENLKPY